MGERVTTQTDQYARLCVVLTDILVASGIMQVTRYLDTIIVCYLEDKTENKGGPYNMSKNSKMPCKWSDGPVQHEPQDSF